jgi:raffinose/stachyose/melibiose transport system permease protein
MRKRNEYATNVLFVGPALLCYTLIVLIPLVMGMYYSFTSWNGISGEVEWIGFDNFVKIFTDDPQFYKSMMFTLRFTLYAVVLTNLFGFVFALILTRALKLKNLLRTAFFLPNVIGGLILGFIWQFIFVQAFPAIGRLTGWSLFAQPWLGDANTAFWGLVVVFVWQTSGYLMVIYIAAIQSIDASLLEAAKIDGAGGIQQLFRIVLPLVVPAFTICLFLSISWSFKLFDLNLSLTNGGPYFSTQSVALNIYLEAFQTNRYGLGSAKALLFFLVVATVSIIQVFLTKRKEVQY